MQKVLDACCGSKMFWFNKLDRRALFMDNRQINDILCDGRTLTIKPDIVADFRNMPFAAETFSLVVFDPLHLERAGDNSWMAKKYGKLGHDWKHDLKLGFSECFRVLKQDGTLIFKWNEDQIKLNEVLKCTDRLPLFGDRRSKTHWIVFIKTI